VAFNVNPDDFAVWEARLPDRLETVAARYCRVSAWVRRNPVVLLNEHVKRFILVDSWCTYICYTWDVARLSTAAALASYEAKLRDFDANGEWTAERVLYERVCEYYSENALLRLHMVLEQIAQAVNTALELGLKGRAVKFEAVCQAMSKDHARHPVSNLLDGFRSSPVYHQMTDARHSLVHRVHPADPSCRPKRTMIVEPCSKFPRGVYADLPSRVEPRLSTRGLVALSVYGYRAVTALTEKVLTYLIDRFEQAISQDGFQLASRHGGRPGITRRSGSRVCRRSKRSEGLVPAGRADDGGA